MAQVLTIDRTRVERLGHYLDQLSREPWVWGKSDCGMWVSNWIGREKGVDPGSIWRGTYGNAVECHRLIQKNGGYVEMVSRRMKLLGFDETTNPTVGDVGMVKGVARFDDEHFVGVVCAIHDGLRWIVRTQFGFAGGNYPVMKAWTV